MGAPTQTTPRDTRTSTQRDGQAPSGARPKQRPPRGGNDIRRARRHCEGHEMRMVIDELTLSAEAHVRQPKRGASGGSAAKNKTPRTTTKRRLLTTRRQGGGREARRHPDAQHGLARYASSKRSLRSRHSLRSWRSLRERRSLRSRRPDGGRAARTTHARGSISPLPLADRSSPEHDGQRGPRRRGPQPCQSRSGASGGRDAAAQHAEAGRQEETHHTHAAHKREWQLPYQQVAARTAAGM